MVKNNCHSRLSEKDVAVKTIPLARTKGQTHEGGSVLRWIGDAIKGILRYDTEAYGRDWVQADPLAFDALLCLLWA